METEMNKQTKSEKRAMQKEAFKKEAVARTQYHFFRQKEKWMVRFCYPQIKWANSPAQISEIEMTEKEGVMFKFVLSQIARREALKSENGQHLDINILQ